MIWKKLTLAFLLFFALSILFKIDDAECVENIEILRKNMLHFPFVFLFNFDIKLLDFCKTQWQWKITQTIKIERQGVNSLYRIRGLKT